MAPAESAPSSLQVSSRKNPPASLAEDLLAKQKVPLRNKFFPATPVPQKALLAAVVRPSSGTLRDCRPATPGLDTIVLPMKNELDATLLPRRGDSRNSQFSREGFASLGSASASRSSAFNSRSAPCLGWAAGSSRLPTARELAMDRRVAARFAFSGRRPSASRSCSAGGSPCHGTEKEEDTLDHRWNTLLTEPLTRDDKKTREYFWREVKLRLVDRHKSVGLALKSLDFKGNGSITFPLFSSMFVSIGIILEQRVTRWLFKGIAPDNLHLPLPELESALMKRTIRKLTHTMQGFAHNQRSITAHIERFLRCLAEVDAPNQQRSADRFQRKLTVSFCRSLWHSLRDIRTSSDIRASSTSAVSGVSGALVEQDVFQETVSDFVDQRWLHGYEGGYMHRIFEHINLRGTRSVPMCDLIVGIVLLCTELDRGKKIGLVFEVFDTDNDGCLTYSQVMDLMMCISMQRSIVECTPLQTKEGGPALQEELSAQEGQRTYECVRWHLERRAEVRDVVNYTEFWNALCEFPQMLYTIVPSTYKLHAILGIEEQGVATCFEDVNRKSFFDLRRVVLTKSCATTRKRAVSRQNPGAAEMADFASSVTTSFRQSLRERGDRRLTNLTESLAPQAQRTAHLAPLEEAQEAQAPPSPSRSSGGERCATPSQPVLADAQKVLPTPPSIMESQLWGEEAMQRYKISQMARSRRSRADDLRLRRERKQAGENLHLTTECVDYDCRVCQHSHQLRQDG